MKNNRFLAQLGAMLLLTLFISSCNTYKWERKRYYKSKKNKNWNNYNPNKSKKEEQEQLKKYYSE